MGEPYARFDEGGLGSGFGHRVWLLRHSTPKGRATSWPYVPAVLEVSANLSSTLLLKYNEETWAGLQELQHVIEQLRDRLKDLIGSDEGRARVSQVGAALLKALPAPKGEE